MKNFYLFLLCFCLIQLSKAQTTRDYAVELRSDFDRGNQQLTVYWPKDTSAVRYDVYGKLKQVYSWTLLGTLGKQDSSLQINGYVKGNDHDFWVKKVRANDSANGYIHVSYDPYISVDDNYGILLLVIDSTYVSPLATEIARLISDLKMERWEVHTHVVQRSDSVQKVKRWIESEWKADSNRVKSLLLLGRVPVPYSGNFNPDAHPDHQGAWPSDVYYVTFDLAWTDNTVNTTSAARTENRNVPGDNKFDQDYIWPALAKIPMGRVDLYDMNAFGSDTLLMRRYLDKNHAFRTGAMKAERRGLIDDNFGPFGGEAFAANGWRVFTPMFDKEVYERDYFDAMGDSSYLFSYGCGGGSYTSAGGIGNSASFVSDSLLNPFSMIFGSYFGDWDCSNNFLRAPLASRGWGLASAWAGRPLWMFHHAAINEPIGFAAMQSQNAWPTYEAGYSGTYTHIALMGDPSLRLYTVAPVNTVATAPDCSNGKTALSWNSEGNEADSVEIWVKPNAGNWQKLNNRKASDSSYLSSLSPGTYSLRIYAMDWVSNPSGFFKVLSHPVEGTFQVYPLPVAQMQVNKEQFCYGDTLRFSDQSTGSNPREWLLNNSLISTATDSFIVLPVGNSVLGLKVKNSAGCTAIVNKNIYQAPELLIGSMVISKADTLPACDSMTNVFTFTTQVSNLNMQNKLVIDWGDATGDADSSLIGGTYSGIKSFYFAGTYQGRVYLYDSSRVCMVEDSFETFVAPNPAPVLISPNPVTLLGTRQDFRASYFDANSTYTWRSNATLVNFIPGDSVHKVTADFYPNYMGIYFVSLFMTNQYGCKNDTTLAVVNYLASIKDPINQAWQVYPNPSQGQVNVRFDVDTEVIEWNLLSLLGQEMELRMETVSPREYVLDLSMLPKGTYLLRAQCGMGTYVVRVVRE